MPPKRICSDKPLAGNNVRENAGVCFKKGLKAGFAAGIQKGTKSSKTKQAQITATASAVAMSKFRTIPVERATNDLRKAYLAEMKYPNYRGLSAAQTIAILRQRGITRVMLPRV
jgi:hypothetical protein